MTTISGLTGPPWSWLRRSAPIPSTICPAAPYSYAPLVDGVWLLVGIGVLFYYYSQKREDWIRNAGAALGESDEELAAAKA